jgi:hypothetical protein
MVIIGAEITRFHRRLRVIAWLCKALSSDRSDVPFRSWSHTNPREKGGAVKPETADKLFVVRNRKVIRNGNEEFGSTLTSVSVGVHQQEVMK